MIRFNNDYNRGAHPRILEALARTNDESYPGYGLDSWCEKAADAIRPHLGDAGTTAQIHFVVGGTQANYTVIAAALRPYQGAVCADCGHIHVHETGAVENTGHKILAVPGLNGKLTAKAVARVAREWETSTVPEHVTQPKLVFLSFPSEFGTIYSLQELEDISAVCRQHNLYLYVDGARMGYGLGSHACDVTLADIARLADAFTIGGTKCGALFGEAVVFVNHEMAGYFRASMKQNGAMLAKGWLLGLQFHTLFEDGLYLDITAKADALALRIKQAFAAKGVPFHIDSPTNQQFVVLTEAQMEALEPHYAFEYQFDAGDGRHCVRFCTSWSTTDAEVDALVASIAAL